MKQWIAYNKVLCDLTKQIFIIFSFNCRNNPRNGDHQCYWVDIYTPQLSCQLLSGITQYMIIKILDYR